MSGAMQCARISGPVLYVTAAGVNRWVPKGPCLMERLDDRRVDVIWGDSGEHSAELLATEIANAETRGDLELIG